MPYTMFDIQSLDKYREDNRLEAKKAKGGLPHSLWETYSAFANTDGGLILIGANEQQDGTLIPTGLTEEEVRKMKKQFWDIINNRQKVSDNILTDKEVYPEHLDGSVILVVDVPRAQRERRPVYIGGDIFSGTYKRNSSGDYHCTKDEVRSMLRDQGSQTVDTKILTGMNLSVLNPESILAFRMNHRNTQLNHPWSNLTDEEFLIRIGAAAISDTDGKAHPTGAGLLMFGNEYEIVREYPDYFLDFREMVNDITEWTDRIWSTSGDWSGNVFDFYRRIVTRIVQDLKVPFRLEGLYRIDDTPQHKAVREALANCLVNADYYGRGGVVVRKHRDRLVFENPGTIRIGKALMLEGGHSDPRNSVVIKMFSMLHIGERAGSGIHRIISAWSAAGYDAPLITERIGNFERTTLTLPLTLAAKSTQESAKSTQNRGVLKTSEGTLKNAPTDTLIAKSTQKRGVLKTSEGTLKKGVLKNDPVKFGKTATAIINAIIVQPTVTREMLAEQLKVSLSTIKKHLKRFKDLGLIERIGPDKGGHWKVKK